MSSQIQHERSYICYDNQASFLNTFTASKSCMGVVRTCWYGLLLPFLCAFLRLFFFSLRIFQMYFLCSYYKKIKSKQYTLGTWMKNEDTWFSSLGNEFMKNWTCVKALMCCLTSDNSNHGIWITRRAQVKKEWKWKISYYFTIYTPLLPQSGWLAMIRQLP